MGENEAHGTLSYSSLSRILFPEHAEESHNCLIISSQTVALPDGFAAARVITSCPYHKYSTLHLIALYMKMHYIHLSNAMDSFLFDAFYRSCDLKMSVMTWCYMTKLLHQHFLKLWRGKSATMPASVRFV